MSEVILYGGGGHAKVVIDCLHSAGVLVKAVIDNKYSGDLLGVPRWKEMPAQVDGDPSVIVAIGDNKIRKRVSEEATFGFANAVHSSVLISAHAAIGKGCMILHRAVIQAHSKIGDHVIINTGAQVDHDCIVGDFVHLAPGSVLCGTITVGEGTLIGAGAIVRPGTRIGKWVTVGAGAVVVKDVPDYSVVVGNPARVIKNIQP